MRPTRFLAALLWALFLLPSALFARGGGGCLAAGTLIATPHGDVPIESLRIGDLVWSLQEGRRISARVDAVYKVQTDAFIDLQLANGAVLHATPEHPVETATGFFTRADCLHAGSPIVGATTTSLTLSTVTRTAADAPAYNLMVSPSGVFFANGVLVHNKGCFLPDTPVLFADGSHLAISEVKAGDTVLAFTANGTTTPAKVISVLTHEVDSYLIVRTAEVELRVTEEHPFYVGDGHFKTIESLHAGDTIWAHDGKGGLTPQRLLSLERVQAHVTVYNLQTEEPHTYFADGIAVHNKGGGGGGGGGGGFHSSGGYYGGHSSSSSGDSTSNAIFFILVFAVIVFQLWKHFSDKAPEENLDYNFSETAIRGKAAKTRELLTFISKVDDEWSEEKLRGIADRVFRELQSCWNARDYTPMEPLLMRDLYELHLSQLDGMARTHEINLIDQLTVDAVDIVHVNYTDKKADRSFTALITATARDYYIDDRTREFLRGDDEPESFQEFWTFQLVDGVFRLREIEQTKESDLLTTENLFEQFTDEGRDQVYGKTAGQTGEAGPALPDDVGQKDRKIERLLNFLVQTDKIWNRQEMLRVARRVYVGTLLGWQEGSQNVFADLELSPGMLAHLQSINAANQANGWQIEYRNFAVRRVEIVHVNNVYDRTNDTFTARISAHAQVIVRQGNAVRREDEYVRAWIEFWTFGRDGSRWVLKEILPDAAGATIVSQENIDEGTGAQMLEWYYSKPRAN